MLQTLRKLQAKNSNESRVEWKPRISPDRQDQRKLIARSMSGRFMKQTVLEEINERIETNTFGQNTGFTRPNTAPAGLEGSDDGSSMEFELDMGMSPVHISDSSMKMKQQGIMPTRTDGTGRSMKIDGTKTGPENKKNKNGLTSPMAGLGKEVRRSVKIRRKRKEDLRYRNQDSTRPSSSHAKRREFVDILATKNEEVEEGLIPTVTEQQMHSSARDPKSLYEFLKEDIKAATTFKISSDNMKTKQMILMPNRKKNEEKLLGMAVIIDPSVITKGHVVVLRIKYAVNEKYERTHTASNIDEQVAMRYLPFENHTRTYHKLHTLHKSPKHSTGTIKPSHKTFHDLQVMKNSIDSMVKGTDTAMPHTDEALYGTAKDEAFTNAPKVFDTKGDRRDRKKKAKQKESAPKFGVMAPKKKKEIVEVEYILNSSNKYKYNLKLSTEMKSQSEKKAGHKFAKKKKGCLDVNTLYDDDEGDVNGMGPMFLPGWEGVLPLFIPAQSVVCQLFVYKLEDDYGAVTGTVNLPGLHHNTSIGSHSSGGIGTPGGDASEDYNRLEQAFGSSANKAMKDSLHFTAGLAQSMNGKMVRSATTMFNTSTLPSVLIAENATSYNTSVFSIKGFAVPCESVGKALTILSKHASRASKNKIANILVPGRQPALHVAALHGNIEAIESLLRGGADINHATYDTTSSALHDAVIGNQPQAVQYLLDNGANDRFVDHKGNSALHLACVQNDLECAAVLMKTKNAGKVLQLKNKRGKTPHDLSLAYTCLRLSVERAMRSFHIVVKKAKSSLKLV